MNCRYCHDTKVWKIPETLIRCTCSRATPNNLREAVLDLLTTAHGPFAVETGKNVLRDYFAQKFTSFGMKNPKSEDDIMKLFREIFD